MAELLVTFAAGASYGMTTVVVGQPLDTIKVHRTHTEHITVVLLAAVLFFSPS